MFFTTAVKPNNYAMCVKLNKKFITLSVTAFKDQIKKLKKWNLNLITNIDVLMERWLWSKISKTLR